MNLAEQYIEKQIAALTKDKEIPDFSPGDTIIVHNKIIDETNERIQLFEGVCIGRTKSKLGSTFKVKKISGGVAKIEVIRKGKVKRAKLYYMRELVGKAARIKEKRDASGKPYLIKK
jgi:large subunit ribosomal protein L19